MQQTPVPHISVVIPVYNEEENIPELYRRLTAVLEGMEQSYEMVFVDDGSADGSYKLLEGLHEQDPRVVVVKFSRNFGHHIALSAGLDHASGKAIVMMDADLQDQPEEIPGLYERLQQGYGMVYAVRKKKKFSWFKRTSSKLYYALMKRIADTGPAVREGVFRIITRDMLLASRRLRESHRNILVLLSWTGFQHVGVEVTHGERFAGETKYTLSKMVRLAVDSIVGSSEAPLRLTFYLGSLILLFALLGYGGLGLGALLSSDGVSGWSWAITTMLFCTGTILIGLGIVGEYLSITLKEARGRPLYVVETLKGGQNPAAEDEDKRKNAQS